MTIPAPLALAASGSTAAAGSEMQAILHACAAVGSFLLGMAMMTDGLKQLGGPFLRELLGRFTTNRLRGLATGFGLTVAMQASSSTVLATMGFVAAGMVTLLQSVAVVAGATVGSTSTSWLMATVGLRASISAFAGPLVLAGALLRMLRRGRQAQFGLFIAGFGLIIVGIASLKESLTPVVALVHLDRIDAATAGGTMLLVLIGTILSVTMQSSAAPVALAMASLSDGSLTFSQAAPLVVGASVGTTSTAVLALPTVNAAGRRVGLIWVIVSVIAACAALALLPFLEQQAIGLTRFLSATDPVALAAFHTSFAFLGALIAIAVAGPLSRRVERLVPDLGPQLTVHLEPSLAGVPSIALESARRSLVATALEVLRESARHLRGDAPRGAESLEPVKEAEKAIEHFLGSLRRDALVGVDAERQVACLQAIDHVRDIRRKLKRRELWTRSTVDGEVGELRSDAASLTDRIIGWLESTSPLPSPAASPVNDAIAFAGRVHGMRPRLRTVILGATAAGSMDPDVADRSLDAMRAIDEYARELSRLAANLDLTRGLAADRAAAMEQDANGDEPAPPT